MRKPSPSEFLDMTNLLKMETVALAKAKATKPLVQDDELKTLVDNGIQATEARIKGIQQFIHENDIVAVEVH